MSRRHRSGLLVAIVTLLALVASGCSNALSLGGAGAPAGGKGADGKAAGPRQIRISMTQIVEHPALDAARKGFQDALAAAGFTDNVKFDFQNAQGDLATAQAIAQKFAADKPDLILAIATPSAQAVAKATKDIPVLITAVTDPVAAGLVQSLGQPGGNVTGTTDMNPVAQQIGLVKQIAPQAKRLGIIYNAGEVNSTVQVKLARDAAAQQGLQVVEATVSNSGEVVQAAQSLVGRVDAIYVPTDNTVVSAAAAVVQLAEKAKLPIISGERSVVDAGGIATIGIDYYRLGKQTGEMAVRILKGEKPAALPIESQTEFAVVVNAKEAAKLGITLPQSLLSGAEVIK
ncbi:MAG: ABC transporter substrate-binding protein [Symbiobacteriia bacterium]